MSTSDSSTPKGDSPATNPCWNLTNVETALSSLEEGDKSAEAEATKAEAVDGTEAEGQSATGAESSSTEDVDGVTTKGKEVDTTTITDEDGDLAPAEEEEAETINAGPDVVASTAGKPLDTVATVATVATSIFGGPTYNAVASSSQAAGSVSPPANNASPATAEGEEVDTEEDAGDNAGIPYIGLPGHPR